MYTILFPFPAAVFLHLNLCAGAPPAATDELVCYAAALHACVSSVLSSLISGVEGGGTASELRVLWRPLSPLSNVAFLLSQLPITNDLLGFPFLLSRPRLMVHELWDCATPCCVAALTCTFLDSSQEHEQGAFPAYVLYVSFWVCSFSVVLCSAYIFFCFLWHASSMAAALRHDPARVGALSLGSCRPSLFRFSFPPPASVCFHPTVLSRSSSRCGIPRSSPLSVSLDIRICVPLPRPAPTSCIPVRCISAIKKKGRQREEKHLTRGPDTRGP